MDMWDGDQSTDGDLRLGIRLLMEISDGVRVLMEIWDGDQIVIGNLGWRSEF